MMAAPDRTFGEAPLAFAHEPVLLDAAVRLLDAARGGLFVDCTLGGAGHAEAILNASSATRLVGFDRDPSALLASHARLASFGERALLARARFSELESWLARAGLGPVDGMLADLGTSSPQLDEASRGFSFRREGPLDMRMDPEEGETALELLDRLDDRALADLLFRLGEERRSRRIARCIRQAREAGALRTTDDLRRAVVRAVGPARRGGIDPATRTFQALRIAVNEELTELDALLSAAPRVLRPGGVLVIISYHSLEDRKVKRALTDRAVWEPLTRKPWTADEAELARNPRARSAKLRAARRVAQAIEEGA